MPSVLRDYDDWLSLSQDGREALLSQWDPYRHEMFWVPMSAAARLAAQAPYAVNDIYVGIYHGGCYVLHLSVSPEHYSNCPPSMSQNFEGFPVIWMQNHNPLGHPMSETLVGKWTSQGDAGDFEFNIEKHDGSPKISAYDLALESNLEVFSASLGFEGDSVEFYTRDLEKTLFHQLSAPQGENFCNHRVSIGQTARTNESAG